MEKAFDTSSTAGSVGATAPTTLGSAVDFQMQRKSAIRMLIAPTPWGAALSTLNDEASGNETSTSMTSDGVGVM